VKEGDKLRLRVIKVEAERRRIGLSLKRVDSPEYADRDWQAAMGEMAEAGSGAPEAVAPEAVEDFDAALEEESTEEELGEPEEAGQPEVREAPDAEGGGESQVMVE
jgi:small subunit ribosomal protein S1